MQRRDRAFPSDQDLDPADFPGRVRFRQDRTQDRFLPEKLQRAMRFAGFGKLGLADDVVESVGINFAAPRRLNFGDRRGDLTCEVGFRRRIPRYRPLEDFFADLTRVQPNLFSYQYFLRL